MRKNTKCDNPVLILRILCIIIIALLLIMIIPLTSKSIRYHHYGEETVGKKQRSSMSGPAMVTDIRWSILMRRVEKNTGALHPG